jgi:hypothetical protein
MFREILAKDFTLFGVGELCPLESPPTFFDLAKGHVVSTVYLDANVTYDRCQGIFLSCSSL